MAPAGREDRPIRRTQDDLVKEVEDALSRWTRRLEDSRGSRDSTALPQARAIAYEANNLRAGAVACGATRLEDALAQVAARAAGPANGLQKAVQRLATCLAEAPAALMSAESRDGNAAATMAASGPLDSAGTVDVHSSGAEGPLSLVEPSLVVPGATQLPKVQVSTGAAHSIVAPAPVHTLLGFRAFGRKSREAAVDRREKPRPVASRETAGVLGLRKHGAPAPNARHIPPVIAPLKPLGRGTDVRRAPELRRGATRDAETSRSAVPPWFLVVMGILAALTMATAATLLRRPTTGAAITPTTKPSSPLPSRPTALLEGGVDAPAVRSAPLTPPQPVHRETPELRALLDAQTRLAAACQADSAMCATSWTVRSRDALKASGDEIPVAPSPASLSPMPAWLRRLKAPADLRVEDGATLRAAFDFDTKNIAGRESFQSKLFNCAAYTDIFDSTIIKYGAPAWLSAVVYQESGCDPNATSPVGARGLWQFMPESARAYGLRVEDGEIDERLNPIKSTDAAIHFLTDLRRSLGSWDLVLAAYNMGPFAVLQRIARMGNGSGFSDLARAGVLPEETASYVPAVEAYALALENLSRLQFSRDGKRLESTAEIGVRPAMRLSLIARAASTTTLRIRELNPEFLRDVIPDGQTTARVPDSEAHRAEAFLTSVAPDDARDMCVPEDFDWGAKRFETTKYAHAREPGSKP